MPMNSLEATRVSVVIPSYNHERFLGQAIDSVLAQTFPAHEIIVVDDGSQDQTTEVLRNYATRVHAIRQVNSGVSRARNAGIALASGDLITFLDADDVWLPRKLERQVACLQAHPGAGLVHCGVEDIDEGGRPLTQILCGLEENVATELLLFRRPVILGGGSGVMIPRRVLDRIGVFDPALSTSADWDLYFRIARNYPVCFIPEVLLQYRRHGSNMHSNIHAMRRDMLHAYAKIFADPAPDLARIRRLAYGCLHAALSGSFYSTRQWRESVRHGLLALLIAPQNSARILGMPVRKLLRRMRSSPKIPTSAST